MPSARRWTPRWDLSYPDRRTRIILNLFMWTTVALAYVGMYQIFHSFETEDHGYVNFLDSIWSIIKILIQVAMLLLSFTMWFVPCFTYIMRNEMRECEQMNADKAEEIRRLTAELATLRKS